MAKSSRSSARSIEAAEKISSKSNGISIVETIEKFGGSIPYWNRYGPMVV